MRKWSDAGRVVKRAYKLPLELSPQWDATMVLGKGLLVSCGQNSLAFVRVPSTVGRKPIEWWAIPPFPFIIKSVAVHLPDNVLAVVEERER